MTNGTPLSRASIARDLLLTQISINGGSIETDVTADTVKPIFVPSGAIMVTTLVPAASLLYACRSCCASSTATCSMGLTSFLIGDWGRAVLD
jgi:hypothetical protein